MNIMQIRVTLKGSKPPIWRRLAVPSNISLAQLHEVIQISMGWTDCHMHQFILRTNAPKPTIHEWARRLREDDIDQDFIDRMDGVRVFVPKTTPWGDRTELDGENERTCTLAKVCPAVKCKLIYEYDFGDGWEHTIEVQKVLKAERSVTYPVCLAGRRACPPEDCGGIWAYYRLLEAIADPECEDHEELSEWVGGEFDPDAFDIDEVNKTLAKWARM